MGTQAATVIAVPDASLLPARNDSKDAMSAEAISASSTLAEGIVKKEPEVDERLPSSENAAKEFDDSITDFPSTCTEENKENREVISLEFVEVDRKGSDAAQQVQE